jgi:hypothetical protein
MGVAHGGRYWDLPYTLRACSIAERDGKEVDGETDRWQPDLEAVKATIDYANKRGGLQRQTRNSERHDPAVTTVGVRSRFL